MQGRKRNALDLEIDAWWINHRDRYIKGREAMADLSVGDGHYYYLRLRLFSFREYILRLDSVPLLCISCLHDCLRACVCLLILIQNSNHIPVPFRSFFHLSITPSVPPSILFSSVLFRSVHLPPHSLIMP